MEDTKHDFSSAVASDRPEAGPVAAPVHAGSDLVENWLDLCSETLTFVANRIREDVNEFHETVHATSPAMLMSVNLRYRQKALTMYQEEAARLMKIQKRLFPFPMAGSDR